MYYLCKGDGSVGYSVIGVVVDGELLSIKKLINENIDVLKNMDMAYYNYVTLSMNNPEFSFSFSKSNLSRTALLNCSMVTPVSRHHAQTV